MTPYQRSIHEEAMKRSKNYRRAEWPLIEILLTVQKEKIYREVGRRSLFEYAVDFLELTEPLAYAFTNVAKKAAELPRLRQDLREKGLSVTKAIRITSILKLENVDELLDFAAKSTTRELDKRRAKDRPTGRKRTTKKPVCEGWVRLSVDLSEETLKLLERVQELQSKKEEKGEDSVLAVVLNEWLDRHDPVRKAERNAKPDFCARKTEGRVALSAQEKHAVFKRDGGRCVFVNERGERCTHTKWVDVHHIIEVSKGGTNAPSNLETLCSFHHDLIHQLSFPIEEQFNWIRATS